jgi:hypothetical protein
MNKLTAKQPVNTPVILCFILLVVLALSFYSPFPLVNSDSVHGFEAMNGYFWTGKWNTLLEWNNTTHQLTERFLTWWSPGQYMAPMILMKMLHIRLGTALTILDFLSALLGTIGYFYVFKRYGFGSGTIWISVVLILLSGSQLTGYYDYDGGECLNFMFFPWIIVFQELLVKKGWRWLAPGIMLFIAFFCKLQMLIVVPPLLFLLVLTQKEALDKGNPFRLTELGQKIKNYIPLIVSVIPVILFIYFGFLARGETPAHTSRPFSLSAVNIFFPTASPFTSIYLFESLNIYLTPRVWLNGLYLGAVSLVVLICGIAVIRKINAYDAQKRKYILLSFLLFGISASIFIFLYVKGTPIDKNPRHLKLSSFLLYPVLIDLAIKKFSRGWVLGLFFFFAGYALFNQVRLNRKWHQYTYVAHSGIRLSAAVDMPENLKWKLDSVIRRKTMVISRYESRYAIDNQLILAVRDSVGVRSGLENSGYPLIFADSLP